MNFLDILAKSGQDVSEIKKILEVENKKEQILLSEVFSGKYVTKEVAILNLQELLENGKSKVGSVYINDNYDRLVEKIQNLSEANIKIIINNNEHDVDAEPFMDENKKRKGRPKKGDLAGSFLPKIDKTKGGAPEPVDEDVELDKDDKNQKTTKTESESVKLPNDDDNFDGAENNIDDDIEHNDNDDNEIEGSKSNLKWLDIVDKIKALEDDVQDLISDTDESGESDELSNSEGSESELDEPIDDENSEVDNDEDSEDIKFEAEEVDTEEDSEEIAEKEGDEPKPEAEESEETEEESPENDVDDTSSEESEPEAEESEETEEEPEAEESQEPDEESESIEQHANDLEEYLNDNYDKDEESWKIDDNVSVQRNEDNTYSIIKDGSDVATDEPKEIIRKVLQQDY